MTSQMDYIISVIIVALVTIMVFNLKGFMFDTSNDNRLYNMVQMQANDAVDILQEEFRVLEHIQNYYDVPDGSDSLRFRTIEYSDIGSDFDNVTIKVEDGVLIIHKVHEGSGATDEVQYPLNITEMNFGFYEPGVPTADHTNATHLRVNVVTESNPEEHVQTTSENKVARATAHKEVFLRNLFIERIGFYAPPE